MENGKINIAIAEAIPKTNDPIIGFNGSLSIASRKRME